MTASNESELIKSQCFKVIDTFAHRSALRDDDVRAWVSEVVRSHGEAAVWHATRAGGFGGSDIGVLVRNFGGHRADHQSSAHDIVASKLLRTTPIESTGDLRRGNENEPRHAEHFYQKYAAHRDTKAFESLSKAQGLRAWMRYSPDDVVLVPAAKSNPGLGGMKSRRLLIDYKAPRNIDTSDSIAFQYACQLHQGAMVCAKAGVHLDGLMLSQFDWANWELKDDSVPYDADLSSLILQAGDYYHEFLMRGEVPSYIMKPKFDRQDEFIKLIGEEAQRLAHISAIQSAFEKEQSHATAKIKAALGDDTRLAGTKMQIGDLSITAVVMTDHEKINKLLSRDEIKSLRKKGQKVEYDASAMASRLTEMGVDVEIFRTDKVDPEKAYDYLLGRGHDPEQLMTEQIRFKVSDHLKESAIEMVHSNFPRISDEKQVLIDAVSSTPQLDTNVIEIENSVREGQFTERHSQRTSMA